MIADIAAEAEISKPQAKLALERMIKLVQDGIKNEGRFPLSGLGTFSIKRRAARKGRNPATGEALKIKASIGVGFKAAPDLKAVAAKTKVKAAPKAKV